ncbi:MAG: RNA chaperone Hfq [Bryobacteraceae bacterium]|nr:RNA chaperone Hfq [Bryobacteraceae bacterium]
MPKSKAPAQTFAEPEYLAHLVDRAVLVTVRLISGEEHTGVVEYWDADFIRLTCEHGPNLFIYKHDIRYIAEP